MNRQMPSLATALLKRSTAWIAFSLLRLVGTGKMRHERNLADGMDGAERFNRSGKLLEAETQDGACRY